MLTAKETTRPTSHALNIGTMIVSATTRTEIVAAPPGITRYLGDWVFFVLGSSRMVRLTFFRSAARGLHVPARLTPEATKHEARKRRASVRPRVGCCEELGRSRNY